MINHQKLGIYSKLGIYATEIFSIMGILLVIYAIWGPTVMAMLKCWFINPMNTLGISIINHSEIGVINQLSYLGGKCWGRRNSDKNWYNYVKLV